jgi:hypothetical protein
MWPSLPTANHIADVANWFFIGSLVVGVVSTILIVWMAGVKEGHWEKDRAESAERVAALTVQGEQLRKDTAEANARALEARVELEKFKEPRTLNAQQQARLVEILKPHAGQQYALSVAHGAEAEHFLCAVDAVLQSALWVRLPPFGVMSVETEACGPVGINTLSAVHVRVTRASASEVKKLTADLASAFELEGIKAYAATDPQNIPTDNAINIMIGLKP